MVARAVQESVFERYGAAEWLGYAVVRKAEGHETTVELELRTMKDWHDCKAHPFL